MNTNQLRQVTIEGIINYMADRGFEISVDDIICTRESLDDYQTARVNYNEPGRLEVLKDVDIDGVSGALLIEGAQAFKGHPVHDMHLFQVGEWSACVDFTES